METVSPEIEIVRNCVTIHSEGRHIISFYSHRHSQGRLKFEEWLWFDDPDYFHPQDEYGYFLLGAALPINNQYWLLELEIEML